VSHDLLTWITDSTRWAARRAPEKADGSWFRKFAPIGLQLPIKRRSITKKPILVGLVAGKLRRAQDGRDEVVAYPFLLREAGDQILVEFSAAGPELEIRRSILTTLAERLLWDY
jgi:hypothetical protein